MMATRLVGAPSPEQEGQGSFTALKPKIVNQTAWFFLREKSDSEPSPQLEKDGEIHVFAQKWSDH